MPRALVDLGSDHVTFCIDEEPDRHQSPEAGLA